MLAEPTDHCRLFLLRHPPLEPAWQQRVVGSGDAELGRRGRAAVLGWPAWQSAVKRLPAGRARSAVRDGASRG